MGFDRQLDTAREKDYTTPVLTRFTTNNHVRYLEIFLSSLLCADDKENGGDDRLTLEKDENGKARFSVKVGHGDDAGKVLLVPDANGKFKMHPQSRLAGYDWHIHIRAARITDEEIHRGLSDTEAQIVKIEHAGAQKNALIVDYTS